MGGKNLSINLNKYDGDIINYLEGNKGAGTTSSIIKKLIRKGIEIEEAALKNENKKIDIKIDINAEIDTKLNKVLAKLDKLQKYMKDLKVVYRPKIVYKGKVYNKFV